jgi:hypothetical protein
MLPLVSATTVWPEHQRPVLPGPADEFQGGTVFQISVQAHGLQAFANSTVDEKLKLTNDQARDGQSPLAELFRHLSNGRVSYRCLTLAAIRT